MKKFSCKVLPIFQNKNKKTCCICLEIKKDCVSCNNPKCNDGIICLKCLGKMKDSQRNQCQICRVEMDVFKKHKVQPQSIITNIRDQPDINVINNRPKRKCCARRKKVTCCVTVQEGLCLIVCLSLFIAITYCTGLIILFWITGGWDTNFNPIVIILLGFVSIALMFGFTWSCGAVKIYLVNKCLNE